MTDIPFFGDIAVGFRVWRLTETGLLTGIGVQHVWRRGMNQAVCDHKRLHLAPSVDCDCGIYARIEPPTPPTNYVAGVVVAHGDILVHPWYSGFRAEQAMIVALAEPDENRSIAQLRLVERAANYYGVPIVRFDELPFVGDRYGVVPRRLTPHPVPVPRATLPVASAQSLGPYQIDALSAVPSGELLDVGPDTAATRMRSIILLLARRPQGVTRDDIRRMCWPQLLLANNDDFRQARYATDRHIQAALNYLKLHQLLTGRPEHANSRANTWRATEAGMAVPTKGHYQSPYPDQQPQAEPVKTVWDDEFQAYYAWIDRLIAPPSGVVWEGTGQSVESARFCTLVLSELLAAPGGLMRGDIWTKHWPSIPHHDRPYKGMNQDSLADKRIRHTLAERFTRAFNFLGPRNAGLISGERIPGVRAFRWHATDKAANLTERCHYERPAVPPRPPLTDPRWHQ